jgi:predicted Fe-Mo cluster-binding NifX family protein
VGPKAFETLRAGNILVYLAQGGTVAEVVEQFKSGSLAPSEKASVEGHWNY